MFLFSIAENSILSNKAQGFNWTRIPRIYTLSLIQFLLDFLQTPVTTHILKEKTVKKKIWTVLAVSLCSFCFIGSFQIMFDGFASKNSELFIWGCMHLIPSILTSIGFHVCIKQMPTSIKRS